MGIVKNTLLITATLSALTVNAGQKFTAMDDTKESHLCVAAATMPLASFGKIVSDSTVSTLPGKGFKDIANNLYCNGESVIKFAQSAGNEQIAERLSQFKRGNISIKDIALVANGNVNITSI